MKALLTVTHVAYIPHLTTKTYTEALLKDESAPNCHSYNLYCVLTLSTNSYMEALF